MSTEDPSDVLSGVSEASSTTPTSLLDSRSHIALPSAHTPKQDRRQSLGLIDAARVRFSKDFRSFVRSNSKSQRIHTPFIPQVERSEDHRFVYPEFALDLSPHLSDFDVEPMDMSEERHGRSIGTKIVNFLSRSRSRSQSKKRRSRSLDAAVNHMPMPLQSASITVQARHASFEDERVLALPSSSAQKPTVRSPSRPLSSTTTATNTTVKPKSRKPDAISVPAAHPGNFRADDILPLPKSSRKKIFGITIPSPRKASFGDSMKSKSRPSTPGAGPTGSHPNGSSSDRGLWSGPFRSASGSQRSHEESSKYPALHNDRNALQSMKDGKLHDTSRPSRPHLVTPLPQPRPAPIHVLGAPSHPRGEYAERGADSEVDTNSIGGRCSPLCGLTSPKLSSMPADKGKEKEKERARGSREREREGEKERERERWKEKERERDRITHPRRVGSPVFREREREIRSTHGPVPMEKVASGSGGSRQSRGRDSTNSHAAMAARTKRAKHGSFDFERPVSAHGGMDAVTVLRTMGVGQVGGVHTMQRSFSAKGTERELGNYVDTKPHQPESKSKPKPALDVNTTTLFLTRRVTGSSTTSAHPRSHLTLHSRGHSTPNDSDLDPASPTSSNNSTNSAAPNGSWGRSAGKRAARGHGAFKFEPAVPTIPGSPADDRTRSAAAGHAVPSSLGPSSPLSKSRQARQTGKGRSLDLGLGLSWAPSKVREEAVLQLNRTHAGGVVANGSAVRARARWRGATVDEEGRLSAEGSGPASDVAAAFREVLGDAAYATFKNYVHRFDAHALPLDGPFGLLLHVQRLLDSAPGLDERGKQVLLDRFLGVVRENR
ncbi:hypothetical protein B0H21DRAFT_584739 [Amylocystis lapponica]|nr:hypothetical protein B0H21DRAFT_584739 [Amylocystis lapponica]